MKKLALALTLLTALFGFGCDTPAENATEERVEDAQEAKGVPEGAAEQQGEAAKDGATAGTYGTTDTTLTTGTTGTTATTATTATTGS